MKSDKSSHFWPSVKQCLYGSVSLAAVTFVGFRLGADDETAASAYLIVIALLSLMGGFVGSVALSIVAVACLSFFVAPPLFSFNLKPQNDILAIGAFLTTSIIISGLTSKLRKSAVDASASQKALIETVEALKRTELYHAEGERLARMGSWAFNPSGRYDFWSEELFRIYGFDPIKGIPTLDQYLRAVHPGDREFMAQTIQGMLAQGLGCNVKKRIVRPDGQVRYIHCVCVPIFDNGRLSSIRGTAIDVTEQEHLSHAQEHLTRELRRREAHLVEAQRLSRTGSFSWNFASDEMIWSEETYRIFDCERTMKPALELVLQRIHPEDRAGVRQLIEQVSDGGNDWDFEYRLLTPGGTVKHVHTVAHPSRDASGQLEYVGAVMDVTNSRRADEELHQTRAQLARVARVTTLGELSASIAHEVSQPLAGIVSSGNACLHWLDNQPPNITTARQSVVRIIRDAERAGQIVGRVRNLVKKTPPQKIWLHINETVEEIISLTNMEVSQNRILLKAHLSNGVPLIFADRVQLQQVILNLVVNAIEALGTVSDGPRELLVCTEDGKLDGLLLTVADTGPGLDPAKLDEIFDAFYTTKREGMGMGLAVSRSIIEAHGGRLFARPNEPRGAIFRFTLPSDRSKILS
jgi:PAS domain S-box-containing protein